MTKVNLVLAGAAMVFAVGCLVFFSDLRTERTRVHALEAQVAQLQREVTLPQPAASNGETAPTIEPPAQTVAAQPVAAGSTTAANKPVPTQDSADRDRRRRVLADPAYRAAALADKRLEMQSTYPQLASELGLSKNELARFLDFLAEQGVQENETDALSSFGEDMIQRRNALAEQHEREQRQFLGEQRFRAWNDYVKSAVARTLVAELRTQLATSSSPLREEQIKPLVKALAAEHQQHWAERQQNHAAAEWTDETPVTEKVAYMERRAELVEQWVARSQEAGAMHLDSTQQRILDELLEKDSERARAEVVTLRAFWEAEERQRTVPSSR
jgi:hypothetical protein